MNDKKFNTMIRFGIMSESPHLKAWEAECIKKILTIKNTSLSVIIYPAKETKSEAKSIIKKKYSTLLFRLNRKFFFKPKSLSPVDFLDEFKNITRIHCLTKKTDYSEYFTDLDVNKIENENLDFIILFSGFRNINGKILNSCKYGIWRFHSGDPKKYSGIPPYFCEMYNSENVSATFLLKLSNRPNIAYVLEKGYYKAIDYSFKTNLDRAHFESSSLAKDVCEKFLLDDNSFWNLPESEISSQEVIPNNVQFIKLCLKVLINKTRRFLRIFFFHEQWNIGYTKNTITDFLNSDERLKIKLLFNSSKDHCYSDPFVIKYQNELYLLFEEFKTNQVKAKISAINFDETIKENKIEKAMEKVHHLSYPHVFDYKDEIYLIPEEWRSNQISLYKAESFPNKWKKVKTLVDNVTAVDATLFRYNNLWWMTFTQKKENPDLKLYIYYSEDLFGPWFPHKKNPVKTDIQSSRPAGNVFESGNKLIRPSQDCSKTYGGSILFNEITKLTPSDFQEIPLKRLKPYSDMKFNQGIHTINSIDNFIFIDCKREVICKRIAFINNMVKRLKQKKLNHSYLKNKFTSRYRYINIPKYLGRYEYFNALDKIINLHKIQDNVTSIYQIGSIATPGISDIDILIILKDGRIFDFNPKSEFTSTETYLLGHNLLGISKSHFEKISNYIFWHNIKHLWGEEIGQEKSRLNEKESNAIKKQIALEFLLKNYMDLSVQLKYGIINLRTTLQQIKALRYDFEFIDLSSGKLYEMVNQINLRIKNWFENPIELSTFNDWLDEFYDELTKALNNFLQNKSLYIPDWGNFKYSRNIILSRGDSLGYEFSGISFPKFLLGINKRTFNLNTRLNSFLFCFPFTNIADDKILEKRFEFYKEIKRYSKKYHANYDPCIYAFANKIVGLLN